MRSVSRLSPYLLALLLLSLPATVRAGDFGNVGAGMFLFVLIALVMFLLFREVICWYWKINEGLELLQEIRDRLGAPQAAAPSSSPAPQQTVPEPLSFIQCPKCTRQYELNMRGLHCEDCGARL